MIPIESSGFTKVDQNNTLTSFLGSTSATGGANWPEAAGACMNEAIRSNWFDNQSAQAREYFQVPASDVIIKEGDDIPGSSYTKITPIPVIVFWSDAPINDLNLSRQYLSATTPTSWNTFKNLWNGTIPSSDPESTWGVAANDSGRPVIDTDFRMMIHFGPSNASGFTTMYDWDKVYYGGSLTTGNDQAVKVIAKKLLEALPDLLEGRFVKPGTSKTDSPASKEAGLFFCRTHGLGNSHNHNHHADDLRDIEGFTKQEIGNDCR